MIHRFYPKIYILIRICDTMAKDNKIDMPTSGGGLMRYSGESRSKLQFKPEHVLILIVVVIVIQLVLHWQAGIWIGG